MPVEYPDFACAYRVGDVLQERDTRAIGVVVAIERMPSCRQGPSCCKPRYNVSIRFHDDPDAPNPHPPYSLLAIELLAPAPSPWYWCLGHSEVLAAHFAACEPPGAPEPLL